MSETFPGPEFSADLKLKGFKAYTTCMPTIGITTFNRRNFYKIVLSKGKARINYADRIYDIDGAIIFFAMPNIPFTIESFSHERGGYSCIFTEQFIKQLDRSESLLQSPLFKASSTPVFHLNEAQETKIRGLYESMMAEQDDDYMYRDDVVRNYLQLLLHEGLRLQPSSHDLQFTNASLRITNQFLELLERQFPVEGQHAPLAMKTAQDYAQQLSIHVNYLNRAVKQVTGRSTTTHISERISTEGMTLLQHTDWSVAEIAYALGFEYPNYFSNFIKKMTGNIPKVYRVH